MPLGDQFPLTPTLSPKEREQKGTAWQQSPNAEPATAHGFSLSFGERVGVRGNGSFELHRSGLAASEQRGCRSGRGGIENLFAWGIRLLHIEGR